MFPSEVSLSARQREVLRYLAAGLSIDEMARLMYLSPNTIRVYRRQVYAALQARNAAQAVNVAHELGILPLAG